MLNHKYWHIGLLAVPLLMAACDDDEVDLEPQVATMRLVVGNQTVNVNAVTGAVTGGPITLTLNTNTTVTATFLRSDGSADPLVTSADFRLEVTPAEVNRLTFTNSGAFTGTLRGILAGNTSATFDLHHVGEGHDEFSWPVSIQIQ